MNNQEFKAGKFTYDIYNLQGSVVGLEKIAQYSVHTKLFIKDNEGKEHSIDLYDWNISCREGHEVIVSWIIKRPNKTGPYVAIKNITTGEQFINRVKITELSVVPVSEPALGCFSSIVTIIGLGIIGYYIGIFLGTLTKAQYEEANRTVYPYIVPPLIIIAFVVNKFYAAIKRQRIIKQEIENYLAQ